MSIILSYTQWEDIIKRAPSKDFIDILASWKANIRDHKRVTSALEARIAELELENKALKLRISKGDMR